MKLLTFDVWMTLIRSNPDFKKVRNTDLRDRFVPNISVQEFTDTLRADDRWFDETCEKAGLDLGFAPRLTRTVMTLRGSAPTPREIADSLVAQEEIALSLPPHLMDEEIPDLLRRLRSRYTVALISNTGMLEGSLMRELLAQAGIETDAMFFSNEEICAKPNPVFFNRVLDSLGVEAGQATHFGDNPNADVRGAKTVGMNAVLVNAEGAPSIVDAMKEML